jgi:hypothetical protein
MLFQFAVILPQMSMIMDSELKVAARVGHSALCMYGGIGAKSVAGMTSKRIIP